jgi:hypothetical protein
LDFYDRPFEDRNRYVAYVACIGTTDRHADGKKLAQQWGKVAVAGPEVYQKFVQAFSMALTIQRGACYPGLLIAGAILWILSMGLLAATPFVQGSTKAWVSRACKGSAVIAAVSIVVASVATTASAYALVRYTSPATSWRTSGRMGAILAVQWAAAGAMSVHALLAFAVAGCGKDDSEGLIRLES